jgi:uncharacterized damage-inducible protein DinB
MNEMLVALYAYDRWAMAKVLDAAGGLTREEWTGRRGEGLRSLRDTLVHIVDTQEGYLSWWDGSMDAMAAYAHELNPEDFHDVAAVREVWERVAARTAAFVDALTEGDEQRILSTDLPDGRVFAMPLWQMMSHVAAHGVQHRAEAAAMLSAADRSPGNLDQLFFFEPIRERGAVDRGPL